MSDTTSPTPQLPEGVAGQQDAGGYVAPANYTAPNPYVAQNPYVAPNPYVAENPATAPNPYAAQAAASNPYAAASAHQPTPTVPAPYATVPYTTGGQAYGYAAPRTNPLAITSMVLSLVGIATWITAIGGVITGHIALNQIKRTGEGGRGMAIAGIVVGYAVTAFALLYILAMVALFGAMWSSGSY